MATSKVTLQAFNSVPLAVGNQYNLVAPAAGHYYFNLLNTGTGNVAISKASTVSPTDPASFQLPPNLALAPLVWGPDGIWVAAGTAETLSVQLVSR